MKKRYIVLFVIFTIIMIFLDYINLPTLLGFEMLNINWDFCIGFLNIIIVISLYLFTYKILDEKTIKREQNKNEISVLLIKECYKECIEHSKLLTQETVEKYIVPKVDFNSTEHEGSITSNLQNSPFLNENIIMDLAKDGQLTKNQIEGYFKVKNIYRQYIIMRIILFDAPHIYEPLNTKLHCMIDNELKKMESTIY